MARSIVTRILAGGTGAVLAAGTAWSLPATPVRYAVAGRTPIGMTLTGVLTVDGSPAPAGSEIAVLDPEGVLCGASGVDPANGGAFILHVYGDDPTTTGIVEGLSAGGALRFEVWDSASGNIFSHGELAFRTAAFGSAPPAYPPPFADRAAYTLEIDAGTNQAPVANAGTLMVTEDTPKAGSLSAADPDGDPLTFSLVPGQGAFRGSVSITNAATGAYTYTPNPNADGSDSFAFRVSDGAAVSNAATVTVTIVPVNDPPVLSPIGSKSVGEGQLLTFAVAATDIENDSLTYTMSPLPAGATLDPATGVFAWIPGVGHAGGYSVVFTVTDGGSPPGSDSQTVTVTVSSVAASAAASNRPPVFAAIGAKSVAEGATLAFAVTAVDPDGDAVALVAAGLPTGATLAGGTFTWTPTYEQAGSYSVTFTATDGAAPVSQTVALAVTNVNRVPRQPVIQSLAPAASDPLCLLSAELSPFADPDPGARLTAVRWEVWQEDPALANVFRLDLDRTAPPTELALPLGTLASGAIYRVSVAYRDDEGAWSPASPPFELPPMPSDPRDLDGDGIQDTAEVSDTALAPGTVRFQDPATRAPIELTPPAGVTVSRLYVTDWADLPAELAQQLPAEAQIPFGLFSFRLEGVTPGDAVSVTFGFPSPLPPDAAWYKVGPAGRLSDFTSQVRFSAGGLAATLTLRDGGVGDADGLENGAIVDPSGPGIGMTPSQPSGIDTTGSGGGGGGGGGGCFLRALTR